MSGDTDRRSMRTKKALKAAMLELLKKRDISRITVRELSELADIGRGTFYLHYADPYDLLDKLEDEQLELMTPELDALMENYSYDSLLKHLESVWRNIYENLDVFKILMGPGNSVRFLEKFKTHCERQVRLAIDGNDPANLEAGYASAYVISGMMGVFRKWMEDGAAIPPERLAKIARGLITNQ